MPRKAAASDLDDFSSPPINFDPTVGPDGNCEWYRVQKKIDEASAAAWIALLHDSETHCTHPPFLGKLRPRIPTPHASFCEAADGAPANAILKSEANPEAASYKLIAEEIAKITQLDSDSYAKWANQLLDARQRHRHDLMSMDKVASYSSARPAVEFVFNSTQNILAQLGELDDETLTSLSGWLKNNWENRDTLLSTQDGVHQLIFAIQNLNSVALPTNTHKSEGLAALVADAAHFVGKINTLDQVQSDRLVEAWFKAKPATDRIENSVAGLVAAIERYRNAAESALADIPVSGAHPLLAREETTSLLIEAFEKITGLRGTHTPREKLKYDGGPHSAAAIFVSRLLMEYEAGIELSDWALTPQKCAGLVRKRLDARREFRRRHKKD